MSIKLTNEINPTQANFCSACFNQDNKKRHVDFDAACDRGYGNDEVTKITMDELVLCEDCIRAGGELVGLVIGDVLETEVEALKRKLEDETKLRKQAQNYADRLEDAFDSRSQPVKLDHRSKPRKLRDNEDD